MYTSTEWSADVYEAAIATLSIYERLYKLHQVTPHCMAGIYHYMADMAKGLATLHETYEEPYARYYATLQKRYHNAELKMQQLTHTPADDASEDE